MRNIFKISLIAGFCGGILVLWIASHTIIISEERNFEIYGKSFGLSAMAGRDRLIFGGIWGARFTEHPFVAPLDEKSMRHDWVIDTDGTFFNFVAPIPLLFIMPAWLWWIYFGRRRSHSSNNSEHGEGGKASPATS